MWGPGGDDDPTPEPRTDTSRDPAKRSHVSKKTEDMRIKGIADGQAADVKSSLTERIVPTAPKLSATSDSTVTSVDPVLRRTPQAFVSRFTSVPPQAAGSKTTEPPSKTQWSGRVVPGYGAAAPKQLNNVDTFPEPAATKPYISQHSNLKTIPGYGAAAAKQSKIVDATPEPAAAPAKRILQSTTKATTTASPLSPVQTNRTQTADPSPKPQWGGRVVAGYGASAPKQPKTLDTAPGATTIPKDYFAMPRGRTPVVPTSELRRDKKTVIGDGTKVQGTKEKDDGKEMVAKAMETNPQDAAEKIGTRGDTAPVMKKETGREALERELEEMIRDVRLVDGSALAAKKDFDSETARIERKKTVRDTDPACSAVQTSPAMTTTTETKEWLGNVGLEGVYASLKPAIPPSTDYLRLPLFDPAFMVSQIKELPTNPPPSVFAKKASRFVGTRPLQHRFPIPVPTPALVTAPTPVATSSSSTQSVQPADQALSNTMFRIPPQGDLSDAEFCFLITKLRGKEISTQEWHVAVECVRGLIFGQQPGRSHADTIHFATSELHDQQHGITSLDLLTQELSITQKNMQHMADAVQEQKRLMKELAQKLGGTQGAVEHVAVEKVQVQEHDEKRCGKQGDMRDIPSRDDTQRTSPDAVPVQQNTAEIATLKDSPEIANPSTMEDIQAHQQNVSSHEAQEVQCREELVPQLVREDDSDHHDSLGDLISDWPLSPAIIPPWNAQKIVHQVDAETFPEHSHKSLNAEAQEFRSGEQELVRNVAMEDAAKETFSEGLLAKRISTAGAVSGAAKQPYKILIPIPEDSDEEL